MFHKSSFTGSESFTRLLFLAGASLIVFYSVLLIIQTITLFAGVRLNTIGTLLAVALSLAYYYGVGRRVYRLNARWLSCGVLALVMIGLIAGWIAGYFIDLSWDGRDYHQKAIRHLMEGWNPVYTMLQPEEVYYNAWLNHYPKGPWMAAASLALLTGNVESGKIFNWLLIASVFLVALSYLLTKPCLRPWQAILLALFLAANPVSINQSVSFYNDGQVSSALILTGLLLLLCLECPDLGRLVALAAALAVGLDIKFTGTAYLALLLAVYMPVSWYMKRKRLSSLAPLWVATLSGVMLGLMVIGYNPYLSNTFRYGHPFYPLFGSNELNKQYILQNQMPVDFESRGWLEKLARSVFSPSDNKIGTYTKPIKFPLSVNYSEIVTFTSPDVRVSGWGPLFGALVIYSLLSLAFLVFISRRTALAAAVMVGVVFATAALNSEAWWARYAPQLWLIPVIVLGALWFVRDRRSQVAGHMLALLVFANIAMVSGAYLTLNMRDTRETRATLAALSESGEQVLLFYGPLDAAGSHLQEYGIPYQLVETRQELPCPRELELMVYYSPLDCRSALP